MVVLALLACPHPPVPASPVRSFDPVGSPNGLLVDGGALVWVDSELGEVRAWTPEAGTRAIGRFPAAERGSWGQPVRGPDGAWLATRFGFGTAGGVDVLAADGATTSWPGLDPARKRIGLAIGPSGDVYSTWYVSAPDGSRAGGVSKLDPAGGERDVLADLQKPVGLAARGHDLVVSDQKTNEVLIFHPDDPASVRVLAALPAPDLLAPGPDGAWFTGGPDGARRITSDGQVVDEGPRGAQVRGVAWDPSSRRLFVAGPGRDGAPAWIRALPPQPRGPE